MERCAASCLLSNQMAYTTSNIYDEVIIESVQPFSREIASTCTVCCACKLIRQSSGARFLESTFKVSVTTNNERERVGLYSKPIHAHCRRKSCHGERQ
jgi:hypothetical protein